MTTGREKSPGSSEWSGVNVKRSQKEGVRTDNDGIVGTALARTCMAAAVLGALVFPFMVIISA